MRTKTFTFKKTKRIKVVTEHPAICVDLTREEAAVLSDIMEAGSDTYEEDSPEDVYSAMEQLFQRLRAFARAES